MALDQGKLVTVTCLALTLCVERGSWLVAAARTAKPPPSVTSTRRESRETLHPRYGPHRGPSGSRPPEAAGDLSQNGYGNVVELGCYMLFLSPSAIVPTVIGSCHRFVPGPPSCLGCCPSPSFGGGRAVRRRRRRVLQFSQHHLLHHLLVLHYAEHPLQELTQSLWLGNVCIAILKSSTTLSSYSTTRAGW